MGFCCSSGQYEVGVKDIMLGSPRISDGNSYIDQGLPFNKVKHVKFKKGQLDRR